MKSRQTILFLLTAALAAGAVSCGSPAAVTTTGADTSAEPVSTEADYDFPTLDYGGKDFTFLNSSTNWSFYTDLDFEEATGDILDDAVYRRNTTVEEKFNCNFVVVEEDIDTAYKTFNTSVMAGDDVYQAAFLRNDQLSASITDGCLLDQSVIPELQLTEPWWDQNVREVTSLGKSGKLFFTATDISLMGFDGTICMFINENMMEDRGLTMPYQLVRDGNWTMDRLHELTKAGASLNGDESFKWDANAKAVYGLCSWSTCPMAMLIGSGEKWITLDKDGYPIISFENDRFYGVCEKVASLHKTEGEWLLLNDDQIANHYELAFKASRCLTICAELKASGKFRDMNDTFGIVPMPKYDEDQENYYSYRSPVNLVLCLPATNTDTHSAGVILDALSYLSWKDVLPIYYDVNVSQKGLRNEESIEMLALIRDTRFFDIGKSYGWTSALYSDIEALLKVGDSSIASVIASDKPAILENIRKTMTYIDG